jgi:hypothetical protein
MPQLQLPIFPDGVTHITNHLAFRRQDGQVTYFNGHMPVFSHAETDIATFRMITIYNRCTRQDYLLQSGGRGTGGPPTDDWER